MEKQDIINYVLETPSNTNPAVLSGMLDSLAGGVEMVTLFDDDISTTSYVPSSQYAPANATGFSEFLSSAEDGIVKVTYEGKNAFGIYTKSSAEAGFSLRVTINDVESPLSGFQLSDYSSLNSFYFTIYGVRNQDTEFEAYCQEPHHLKVEWFTV